MDWLVERQIPPGSTACTMGRDECCVRKMGENVCSGTVDGHRKEKERERKRAVDEIRHRSVHKAGAAESADGMLRLSIRTARRR